MYNCNQLRHEIMISSFVLEYKRKVLDDFQILAQY
jgi:hypothetical protein